VTTLALVVAAHLHLTQTHFTPEQTMQLILERNTDGQGFSRLALNAAKLCATVVVTAWNFSASKFITFKS
jgi:putative flippase GtrA